MRVHRGRSVALLMIRAAWETNGGSGMSAHKLGIVTVGYVSGRVLGAISKSVHTDAVAPAGR